MNMPRMTLGFLDHHTQDGTLRWDIIVAKVVSVVLVASLESRAGDVVRSRRWYGDEYLRWKHIELVLEHNDSKLSFINLRAKVTLEYTKGSKDTRNESVARYLRPLEDDKYRHACPITWLLIHALSHGLVGGTTIEQALTDAAARNDGKFVWLYPQWPVCAAISVANKYKLDLRVPAGNNQASETLSKRALVSNILTRVHMHALRAGAAVDIAHLSASDRGGRGLVTSKSTTSSRPHL